jgi:K+-transporting ATPase c subunit
MTLSYFLKRVSYKSETKLKKEKKSLPNLLMQNDQLKKRIDTTIRLLNQLVVSLESTPPPYY